MPKERECEKRIPALHRKKMLDIALFFYVSGLLDTFPSITIKQAVLTFMKNHKVSEDGWSLENALQTYSRMRAEILNYKEI